MAAKTTSAAGDALKQLTYLAAALKAPRITEAAARLADHAGTPAGPTRSTSPRSWTVKSPPATPPAPSCDLRGRLAR